MKVLVTGASGFIGSHLIGELLLKGYDVQALVRESSDLTNLTELNPKLFSGDILEPDTLLPAIEGCEIVFHVAAIFAYWGYTPNQLNKVAEQGTLNVMQAAHHAGVKRVVLTSSSVVLDLDGNLLSDSNATTVQTLKDQPDYVHSKIRQLKSARSLGESLGIDLVTVCPTLTVGASDVRLSESNRMIVNYLADPYKSTWIGGCNIVSVRDVARAHILAAEKGIRNSCYLVGSDNLEWADVHRILSELTGLPGPLFTANHTLSYMLATFSELTSLFTKDLPQVTRAQAKMVGHYYWYSDNRLKELGLSPMSSRQALAEAVSWLVTSSHVPASVRSLIQLSDEIYEIRQNGL